MTHLRLAAIFIATFFSFQIYAATGAQADTGYKPPTNIQRSINIPNNVKNKFTTNDADLDSRISHAARQRMARENRRNHNNHGNRNNRQQQSQNTNDDDRTQGEDRFTQTNQRQGRQQQRNTNNNRLTKQQGQGAQSVNSKSGLND